MKPFKQTLSTLVENRLLKTGRVIGTRSWEPGGGLVEIDLHLPGCDMSGWGQAQHIKCRVAAFTYRDYTPAGWDPETNTCTLYIDASHVGPGSLWAAGLKTGDEFSYLGVAPAERVEKDRELVFLGDESALGHFLALLQLSGPYARVRGALSIQAKDQREQFTAYFPGLGLQLVEKADPRDYQSLLSWPDQLVQADSNPVFYLAGYIPAVVQLRKALRQKGYAREQIRAKGFWE